MIINTNLGFAFIHIPKTGGVSIEEALQPWDCKAKRCLGNRLMRQLRLPRPISANLYNRHDTLALAERMTRGEDFQKLRSFAVVRNPYDHAVSHYNFMCQLPARRYGDLVRRLSFEKYLLLRLRPASEAHQIHRNHMWFLRLPDQTSFISDRGGQIVIDHLIRFENLAEDWASTLPKLGLPEIIPPHRNKGSHREGRRHEVFYTPACRDLVQEIYQRDFRNFGYEV